MTVTTPRPVSSILGVRGRGARGRPPLARREAALVAVAVLACLGVGIAIVASPLVALLVTVLMALGVAVAVHPPLAAYLLVGLTPLIVGIDRGRVVPLLRPNEVLLALCAGALLVRGVWELRSGARFRPRLGLVAASLVLMAVCNSVLPLLWMGVRHQPISSDDLSYAAVLWKFLGLYAVVRYSVRTEGQAMRCLWIGMTTGGLVAVIAILQSLHLFGIDTLLDTFYASVGDTSVLSFSRGSATLGLAAATGDLMIFNLAIAAGYWNRYGFHPKILAPLAVLFLAGIVSAGEFSTIIGMVVAIVALGILFRRADVPIVLGLLGLGAGVVLAPVVMTRLSGFRGGSLPESWVGRLANLRGYFWPRLLEHDNFLLGVQPSARVPSPDTLALPWIWIESGYIWLFWGGGVPLFAAFVFFVIVTVRRSLALARRPGALGVTATGVFVAVLDVAVLMLFDPHITYRGSADMLFVLLALMAALGRDGGAVGSHPHDRHDCPGVPADPTVSSTEVEP
ncbi:MAG: hypothetical protein QOE59_3183 [Actinomycetota bacterium]|nr:hypothetical protein [Actinomycetota bacterium]